MQYDSQCSDPLLISNQCKQGLVRPFVLQLVEVPSPLYDNVTLIFNHMDSVGSSAHDIGLEVRGPADKQADEHAVVDRENTAVQKRL